MYKLNINLVEDDKSVKQFIVPLTSLEEGLATADAAYFGALGFLHLKPLTLEEVDNLLRRDNENWIMDVRYFSGNKQ